MINLLFLLMLIPSAYAETSDTLGVQDQINNGFDWLREFWQQWATDTDVENLDLPNQPTNEELDELINKSVDTGQAGTDLYFAFKDMIIAFINFASPVEIALIFMIIIATIVSIFLFLNVGGSLIKHLFILLLILIVIMVLIMVSGINIEL